MKNTKNIKTFLVHLGLYSLVILSYFVIFSSIISSVLESLMMGTSQYIALPILLFLSALYIIPLWKWYQHDLKLEVKKNKDNLFCLATGHSFDCFYNFPRINAHESVGKSK